MSEDSQNCGKRAQKKKEKKNNAHTTYIPHALSKNGSLNLVRTSTLSSCLCLLKRFKTHQEMKAKSFWRQSLTLSGLIGGECWTPAPAFRFRSSQQFRVLFRQFVCFIRGQNDGVFFVIRLVESTMLSRISWRACRVAGLSRSFAVPSSHCIVVARRCLPFNHAFSVSPVTVVRASFSTTAGTKQHSSNNYGKRVSDVSDGIHILLESVRRLTSSQAEAYAFLQCLRQFIITKSNMPDNNTTTFATYFSECERSESFALLRWKDIKNIRQLAVEVVSLPSVYEVDCSLFYLQTRHPTSCSIPSYSLNYLYRNGHNTDSAWPTSTPSTSTSSYRPLRLLPSSLSSLLSSLFPSPSSSSPSLQSEANFNNIMHMYRWNPNLQASRIVPTHPYDPWRLRHAVFIDFSSRAMSLTTNTHHILNAIKPMFAGVGAPIVGMEIMVKEFKPTCGILYFATEQAARNALSPWFQAMGSPDFPSSPPMDKVNAKRRKDKLTCVYTSPCVSKTGMFVFSMPKELQYVSIH